MITYERVKIKLEALANNFSEAVRRKDWYRAKYIYNKALIVSTFLELSDEDKDWLWGHGEEDKEGNVYFTDSLFKRYQVQQMETQCVKHHIETRDMIGK